MIATVAPALRALVEDFIDYAGLFPPAGLPLEKAIANYEVYRQSEQEWMLRWFVLKAQDIESVPEALHGRISLLVTGDLDKNACNLAAAIESTATIKASRPVYCEVSPLKLEMLDEIKKVGNFAKIRCGGVTREAIPRIPEVRDFILGCAERRLAFKATAGLHHPLRAEQKLTYQANAPRAVMHGFLNVLLASAFAWHGHTDIDAILAQTDPEAFSFGERAEFGDVSLTEAEIRDARLNFIHSIGSCSFEEPVDELKGLGLL
ncbi:MAG: hypothetical protein K8F91_20235 [Candidatus Obscuribacterales bacterium]|nr:hypothetical protein [Candidatus Obscuribacterales bacterium]